MPSDAAQLNVQEQQTVRSRLRRLADQFTAEGILRSPQWQAVFQRTWRHPYVPVYYPELGTGPAVGAAEQAQRADWLSAVYSDESLITKVVHVPSPRGPGYQKFTSSSTLPSLMLTMLEALDVTDGCRVLEIGTGSGYNAALLCERLGSELVTSIDVDPELIDLAQCRLATTGYTPTLAATDGARGYPPRAPYDRIIATCSVPAIPPAWLEQTAPGGIILTDVRGPLGGTLVKLTVNAAGVATGRFLPHYGSFMPLRPAHTPAIRPTPDLVDNPVDSVSDVDPTLVQSDGHLGFIVQWHLPDVIWGHAYAADGDIGMRLCAPDGSGAEAWHTPTDNGFLVRQAGPRRLWDRVEQAVAFWQQAGQPHYDRFGLTATNTEQYVWYDQPDSPHRWPPPPRLTAPVVEPGWFSFGCGVGCHGGGELVAGVDVEFTVGDGEVVADGFGGDEQCLGDVAVAQGLRGQPGDP